ncbi:MAG: hypothetical protein IPH20_20460 [Bacteroidales bacterium]|nr:hypothetical protein [Bacteroidales bacterium]
MTEPITITPLTCEFLEPLALNPLEIHRHDHEELWIITHGTPRHSVNFSAETLQSPVIVYVAQGKVHAFVPDEDTRGWLIGTRAILFRKAGSTFIRDFWTKCSTRLVKIVAAPR